LISSCTQERYQPIAIFRGVVEQDGVICTFYRDGKIFKAASVASPNVFLGNVVASRQNPIPNSRQIDLDILGSDVNQHDFKSASSRVQHHVQIILSRQRSLNRETLGSL
jgi:hypothetical protein